MLLKFLAFESRAISRYWNIKPGHIVIHPAISRSFNRLHDRCGEVIAVRFAHQIIVPLKRLIR